MREDNFYGILSSWWTPNPEVGHIKVEKFKLTVINKHKISKYSNSAYITLNTNFIPKDLRELGTINHW